jgi:hypothetical protein
MFRSLSHQLLELQWDHSTDLSLPRKQGALAESPVQLCILEIAPWAGSSQPRPLGTSPLFHLRCVVTSGCFPYLILHTFLLSTVRATHMQLGGKSAVIVDKSADLKLTARRVLWAKTINAGQVSSSPRAFMALFIHLGDLTMPFVYIGHLTRPLSACADSDTATCAARNPLILSAFRHVLHLITSS